MRYYNIDKTKLTLSLKINNYEVRLIKSKEDSDRAIFEKLSEDTEEKELKRLVKNLSLGEIVAIHYFKECEISLIRDLIYKLSENIIDLEKKELKNLKTKTEKE